MKRISTILLMFFTISWPAHALPRDKAKHLVAGCGIAAFIDHQPVRHGMPGLEKGDGAIAGAAAGMVKEFSDSMAPSHHKVEAADFLATAVAAAVCSLASGYLEPVQGGVGFSVEF